MILQNMNNKESQNHHNITLEGIRYSEAHTYLMNNAHLNNSEKLEVELWYQFPLKLGYTILCFSLIYSSVEQISIRNIIVPSLVVNVAIGLLNWYNYRPTLNKIFFYSIGHNYLQRIILIVTISFLIYSANYYWIIVVVLGKIGFLYMFYPSMILYSLLARKYRLHPKYAFFKRNYGKIFSFEEDLKTQEK